MLTKEECLISLAELWYFANEKKFCEEYYLVLQKLIKEHFELVEENNKLKRMLETFK